MKSRRERRAVARENGTQFEPQYKGRVITKAEYDKEVQEFKELRKKSFAEMLKESKENREQVTEK